MSGLYELKLNVQHGTKRRGGPAGGSFVLYLRRESYINYVRRVQVYTQLHQSINGVVNITLRIWYFGEDIDTWPRSIYSSNIQYIYTWERDSCASVHTGTAVHARCTHAHTEIGIKGFKKTLQNSRNESACRLQQLSVFMVEMVPVWGGLEWRFRFEISVLHRSLAVPEAGVGCVERWGGDRGCVRWMEGRAVELWERGDAQPLGLGQ